MAKTGYLPKNPRYIDGFEDIVRLITQAMEVGCEEDNAEKIDRRLEKTFYKLVHKIEHESRDRTFSEKEISSYKDKMIDSLKCLDDYDPHIKETLESVAKDHIAEYMRGNTDPINSFYNFIEAKSKESKKEVRPELA